MKKYSDERFTGERALYRAENLNIERAVFDDGESPLKHSKNIDLLKSSFRWKYPLWYAENINLKDSSFFEMSRSGLWYGKNISLEKVCINT